MTVAVSMAMAASLWDSDDDPSTAALASVAYGASASGASMVSLATLTSRAGSTSTNPIGSCAPSIGPPAAPSGAMQTPRAASQTFPPLQSPDF
jgi:hypothetical protein